MMKPLKERHYFISHWSLQNNVEDNTIGCQGTCDRSLTKGFLKFLWSLNKLYYSLSWWSCRELTCKVKGTTSSFRVVWRYLEWAGTYWLIYKECLVSKWSNEWYGYNDMSVSHSVDSCSWLNRFAPIDRTQSGWLAYDCTSSTWLDPDEVLIHSHRTALINKVTSRGRLVTEGCTHWAWVRVKTIACKVHWRLSCGPKDKEKCWTYIDGIADMWDTVERGGGFLLRVCNWPVSQVQDHKKVVIVEKCRL